MTAQRERESSHIVAGHLLVTLADFVRLATSARTVTA